ncbi:hypothetical protein BKA62DRAFT_706396 [Auriculariales sp. MPI-PUGE-AT-0066]|nr:hypothetical protein BKA62DRAFT_706396 [Auriculariales sp. MPI-PUGE-AT-0066]
MSRIPVEIIQHILEDVWLVPDDSLWSLPGLIGRRRWLASTLLVSHDWRLAGLPVLYHHVEIAPSSERALKLFLHTISKRRHIAHLVKELRLVAWPLFPGETSGRQRRPCIMFGNPFPTPRIPFRATKRERRIKNHAQLLSDILKHCEDLVVLHLHSEQVNYLVGLVPALCALAPRLRELKVVGCRSGEIQLVESCGPWLQLRSLNLDDAGFLCQRMGYDLLLPSTFPLLETLEIPRVCSEIWMRLVLHCTRGTLRILRCLVVLTNATTVPCDWITSTEHGLVELSVAIDSNAPLPDFSRVRVMKHLKVELSAQTIRNLPHQVQVPSLPASYSTFESLVPTASCPPTVETFEWVAKDRLDHAWPWSTAQRVYATLVAFDSGGMPHLREVVLHLSVGKPSSLRRWTIIAFVLREAAIRRGVRFRFDVSIRAAQEEDDFDCFAQNERARVRQPKVMPTKSPGMLMCVATGFVATFNCLFGCVLCVGYLTCCCCFTAQLCPERE